MNQEKMTRICSRCKTMANDHIFLTYTDIFTCIEHDWHEIKKELVINKTDFEEPRDMKFINSNTHYYLNEDHTYRPCSLSEWSEQIEYLSRNDKKHVADDVIDNKRISTVWLGLDHNYYGGEPLLFETMIFDQGNNGNDIYMKRYSDWDDAAEGHERAKQWVLNGCKDYIE